MSIIDTRNLPLPVLQAIRQDDHISQGSDIGAATVGAPVRQVALRRKHRGDIVEEASDRIWSLFGQAVHVVLERAALDEEPVHRHVQLALQHLTEAARHALAEGMPDIAAEARANVEAYYASLPPSARTFRTFVEERWEMDVLGWKVAARCDHLAMNDEGTLTDYKVSSVWSVKDGEAKPEWVAQLNVTRMCATVAKGLRPKKLQATVFLRDWRKNERLRYSDEYPALQVATVPVPLWSDAECMAYLNERIALHQAAQAAHSNAGVASTNLPLCTPEERWAKPTIFAVMKKGRKTAVRLYENRALADQHAASQPDLTVVVRPGESTRCAQYCDALKFCDQGQKILAALKAATPEGA